MQVADIASAEDSNNPETDRVLDFGDSFAHVHNIEKFRIIVNVNSVYFIIQIAWALTDDGTFARFGDMELLEMYAQCFNTEL